MLTYQSEATHILPQHKQTPTKMEKNAMVINGLTMLFIAPVVCVVLYWLSKWA